LVNQANPAPIFDEVEIQRRKRKFWRIAGAGLIVLLPVAVYLLRFLVNGIKRAQEAFPQIQHFAEHYPKTLLSSASKTSLKI
jgi:hypothetical protein